MSGWRPSSTGCTALGLAVAAAVTMVAPVRLLPEAQAANRLPPLITLTNTWLNATNGILLTGAQAFDSSGISVSTAGDVNGDGYADLLIGAYAADPAKRDAAGETYLIYGRTNGLPALITLTNTWLNGTNGTILAGAKALDHSGFAVSSAGDVNGDGLADLLVGANDADPSGRDTAGETYLIYGRTNGLPALITLTNTWLNGTNGIILAGMRPSSRSGSSVRSAGDVNGDGCADLLVGAYAASPGGRTNAGETYLIYGRTNGFPALITLTNTWLNGTNGIILAGVRASDFSGHSVSSAGDVNGDGLADLLVGAPTASPSGRNSAGETYLIYGRTNGLPALITLTNTWLNGTNGIILAGARASDFSGYSVSSAGDVNGDRLADLLVGAYKASPEGRSGAGETYLIYGRTNGLPALITLTNTWMDGTNGIILAGGAIADGSGWSVSSAGDINGDGLADLLVGAYKASPGARTNAGETYLIYGRTNGLPAQVTLTTNWLNGTNGIILAGAQASDYSGYSVSAAGDVNGDAFGDLLVGASQASPSGLSYAGETYLVYGRPTSPAMLMVGTNGASILSGEPASMAKGTVFRPVTNGVAVTNTFAITNLHNLLRITGISTNGTGASRFRVLGLPATVVAGTKSNISVVFTPAGLGAYTAAVHLVNDSTTSPFIVYLTGTGIPPVPTMLMLGTNGAVLASGEAANAAKGTAFGSLAKGQAATNWFVITNGSPFLLTISGVETNGVGAAGFRVLGLPSAVAAGARSNVSFIFSPPAGGLYTAAVHLANNSATSPYIAYLSGAGPIAGLTLLGTNGAAVASGETASLAKGNDFGSITNGQGVTNRFSITNNSLNLLTISGVITSGAGAACFQVLGLPTNVAAGSKSNVSVAFQPTGPGVFTAAVHLVNDSTTSPYIVRLAGAGPMPAMAVLGINGAALTNNEAANPDKGTAFGTATAGKSVTNRFAITNSSLNLLTISGASTSGAGAACFRLDNLPAFVAAGAISNFSLIFSPATVGTAYTAAVHLANNSAITTYILNLTGTGGNGLLDQTITFPPLPTQKITSQVGLAATSSSGLPVSFGVLFGPGVIHDGTNLTFSTVGTVAVLAAQPGNAEWNPAPNVTNRFLVLGDAAFSLRATALTNSVMLRWTDPLSAGLSNPAVLVRCHTSHYPTNTGDGTLTYQGTNTVFHHVDLTNGQTYYYTIWVSHDGAVFIDPP